MPLGNWQILVFSYKSYAGHPRFYRFRAPGALQFSLEHSLAHLRKPGLMEIALSLAHSETLECISAHAQCILKHYSCYPVEPKNVQKPFENHSEVFRKRFQMFAKCFSLTSFLCIFVCHVFTWEVTFWHMKLKANFASS